MSDRRTLLPIYDATEPVACTLGDADLDDRLALLERMRDELDACERTPHGLLLCFAADDEREALLRRFAVDEKRCCAFFGFDVLTDDGLALRWDAPPDAGEIVDDLAAFFRGERDLADLRSLI